MSKNNLTLLFVTNDVKENDYKNKKKKQQEPEAPEFKTLINKGLSAATHTEECSINIYKKQQEIEVQYINSRCR